MEKQQQKVVNFGAGPAKLPHKVLLEAQKDMLSLDNTGMSILEVSHRSPEFARVLTATIALIRELLEVPSNYHILFMQGGGSAQFSAVALNLLGRHKENPSADYIVTGIWSSKAATEAAKFGRVRQIVPKTTVDQKLEDQSTWELDPQASYLYYCDNETVHGVEFPNVPKAPPGVPVVCDMSSNFMSRPINVSQFGLIFAGAQKNVGCSGTTIVIVREDLLHFAPPNIPLMMDYKTMVENNSLYNTPPTFGIYIVKLVMEWMKNKGGVAQMASRSEKKSRLLYNFIDSSQGFYTCPVEAHCRSRMNVVFRILSGNQAAEKQFLKEAQEQGLLQLEGHRSVGGLRASLYNAIKPREVEQLTTFMKEFQQKYQAKSTLANGDTTH